MLMCWGPYVLMCIYACFENVKLVSPKLRMVSTFNLTVCGEIQSKWWKRKEGRHTHVSCCCPMSSAITLFSWWPRLQKWDPSCNKLSFKSSNYEMKILVCARRCFQLLQRQIPSSTRSSTRLEMSSTEAAFGISSPGRRSLIRLSRRHIKRKLNTFWQKNPKPSFALKIGSCCKHQYAI